MKKYLAVWIAATLCLNLSRAQDQLENTGFEEWEDVLIGAIDTIREPVDWSSLKTSDEETLNTFAPVVCKRSTEAHNGKYAVQLTNVSSLLVANGTVTTGRVHPNLLTSLAYMFTDTANTQWNTPLTYRPDSITGWFRYSPQPADTLEVRAVLHRGFGKQPDINYLNNWIGEAFFRSGISTGSQWVRFSAPFVYFSDQTPQYALVILNSGNGFNPVAGSIAWFDDLRMIYNSTQAPAVEPAVSSEFIYAPDNQYIVIRGSQPGRYTTASIMDITGRLIWNGRITSDRIDIAQADLKKGIYLIILTGKNISFTNKIVVR
jgi:hypothetical protein